MKIFFISLFCLITAVSFGQNDAPQRQAFTLKLLIDSTSFYEQEIPESSYFVAENVLQIFPGEDLYIEVEVSKNEITSMKVVKEILNPKKTIELNFSQIEDGRESSGMMLKVANPFSTELSYNADMYVVGRDKWIETSIVPISPKIMGIEMWAHPIITMALTNWSIKE